MAVRLDRCIFEILVRLTAAELQALCEFIQTKIGVVETELNKALAYAGTAEEQINQVSAVLKFAQGFLGKQSVISPLLGSAADIAPDCPELSLLFTGAIGSSQFTKASLDTINYIQRQLTVAKDVAAITRSSIEDTLVALRSLCTIINEIIARAAFNRPVDDFLKGDFQNINQFLDSKIPDGKIQVKIP